MFRWIVVTLFEDIAKCSTGNSSGQRLGSSFGKRSIFPLNHAVRRGAATQLMFKGKAHLFEARRARTRDRRPLRDCALRHKPASHCDAGVISLRLTLGRKQSFKQAATDW